MVPLVFASTLAVAALPASFQRTTVATGLTEPTVIKFTPDGRLLIGERGGRVRVVQGGTLLPLPLIQLPDIDTRGGERGLVGMALDPAFASNGWLYLYYTTGEPRNRVGRFTVVGNAADPASEVVVWQNPALAAEWHHGGSLAFGSDGTLFIATGDQFNSANSRNLANQQWQDPADHRYGRHPPRQPLRGRAGRPASHLGLGAAKPLPHRA